MEIDYKLYKPTLNSLTPKQQILYNRDIPVEEQTNWLNAYWNDVLPTYVKYATEGERFEDVIKRAHEFLVDTTNKYPDEKIIVVTHGFTVKAFALDVLRPSDLMSLPEPQNTSVTKIDAVSADETYLEYYNLFFD